MAAQNTEKLVNEVTKKPIRKHRKRKLKRHPRPSNMKFPQDNVKMMPYEEAKAFVQSNGIVSTGEWMAWNKNRKNIRPTNMPLYLKESYGKEYEGYVIFFRKRVERATYAQHRELAKIHGILTIAEWENLISSENIVDGKRYVQRLSRAFKTEWTSFAAFIDDPANKRREKYRNYGEARHFAHTLKCITEHDWNDAVADGRVPKDIPANPSNHYKQQVYGNNIRVWTGWRDFLGSTVDARIHELKNNDVAILCLIRYPDDGANTITIFVERGGKPALVDKHALRSFKVLKLYHHEPEMDSFIQNMLNTHGQQDSYNANTWTFNNVATLLYEFDTKLLRFSGR